MDRSLKWAVAIVITLILVLSPVFSQGSATVPRRESHYRLSVGA